MSNIRLSNNGQIKRFIANLINKLMSNEIEEGKARTLGYLTQIQLKTIENYELEKKVKELELLLNDFLEKQENE